MPGETLEELCSIDGCDRMAICKGMCMRCYGRARRPPKTNQTRERRSLLAEYADEWRVLNSMRSRCYREKNPSYKNYGAKGIKVCDRWLGRDGLRNFVEDMGRRPRGLTNGGRPIYSIDRIDSNGDYTPSNCRWATIWEQNQNTSRNNSQIGVYRLRNGSWRAEITVSGKTYSKQFRDYHDAVEYRKHLESIYQPNNSSCAMSVLRECP